jgi:hypothetical protein
VKNRVIAACCGLLMLAIACGRSGPKPLTLEEIPAALSNAFASSSLLVKQNAQSIGKLVTQKQYAAATIQLQTLLPLQITGEQRNVASAALATLNEILQQQVASASSAPPEAGVSKSSTPIPSATKEEAAAAAEVMNHYIRTK